MTRLFLTLSLLLSTAALAETCFKAVTEIPVESKIPETICINSAQLNLVDPGFPKAPYYEAVVVSSLGTLSELANPKEHKAPYRFGVIKTLVEQNDWGCGEYYASQVNVTFDTNARGKTIDQSLRVYGEILFSSDRCHMSTQSEILEFSQI